MLTAAMHQDLPSAPPRLTGYIDGQPPHRARRTPHLHRYLAT